MEEQKCSGKEDVGCHWKLSTLCMDCTRYEKFVNKGRHWGAVKDRFITPEDHKKELDYYSNMLKAFYTARDH